jgi:hypothetical protein
LPSWYSEPNTAVARYKGVRWPVTLRVSACSSNRVLTDMSRQASRARQPEPTLRHVTKISARQPYIYYGIDVHVATLSPVYDDIQVDIWSIILRSCQYLVALGCPSDWTRLPSAMQTAKRSGTIRHGSERYTNIMEVLSIADNCWVDRWGKYVCYAHPQQLRNMQTIFEGLYIALMTCLGTMPCHQRALSKPLLLAPERKPPSTVRPLLRPAAALQLSVNASILYFASVAPQSASERALHVQIAAHSLCCEVKPIYLSDCCSLEAVCESKYTILMSAAIKVPVSACA